MRVTSINYPPSLRTRLANWWANASTAHRRHYLRFRISSAETDRDYYAAMEKIIPATCATLQRSIDEWATELASITPTQRGSK
jgi:hypothetical protein